MAAEAAFFVVGSAFNAPLTSIDEILIRWGEGRMEAVGNDIGQTANVLVVCLAFVPY